ncbi:MAG: glycosidase, partial [Phycisphaerae bacterium]|nr:glycosidase [Phycisphaerae bacterium]
MKATTCTYKQQNDLFNRFEDNPILSPTDWPYPANAVFNPAAICLNGQTLLLARVEDRRGFSHLAAARSEDGLTNWQIDPEPMLEPDPEAHEERWGLEDARIVRMADSG